MWQARIRNTRKLSLWVLPILVAVGATMSGLVCHIIGYILLGISALWIVILLLPWIFPEVPHLNPAAKKSKTIWGLWYTGDRVRKKKLLSKYDVIRKVIVLKSNANNPELIEAAREGHGSIVDTIREIRLLTYEVYKQKQSGKRIELRYTTKRPDESFTIFEPIVEKMKRNSQFSDEAWVVLSHPRSVPVSMRSNRMFKKGKYPIEFKHQVNSFQKVWDRAKHPDRGELKEALRVGESGK